MRPRGSTARPTSLALPGIDAADRAARRPSTTPGPSHSHSRVAAGSMTASISRWAAMLTALPFGVLLRDAAARTAPPARALRAPPRAPCGSPAAPHPRSPSRRTRRSARRRSPPARGSRRRSSPSRRARSPCAARPRRTARADAPRRRTSGYVPHLGAGLDLRPDHEPGRVDQRDEGKPVRIAQLHEPRGLVGGIGVDGAAEMRRIACEQADRPAFDARERGEDPDAEAGPQLEQRAGVGDASHRPRACRRPGRGSPAARRAARSGSAASQVGEPALEVAEVSPCAAATASASSSTSDVDHAVARLHVARADLLGAERRRARRPRPSRGRPCRCCCRASR